MDPDDEFGPSVLELDGPTDDDIAEMVFEGMFETMTDALRDCW